MRGKLRFHYKVTLRLEQQISRQGELREQAHRHSEYPISTDKAYGEWLFHGPMFQMMDEIEGLSATECGSA